MEKLSEQERIEKIANGEMSYIEYIHQHDDDFIDEYKGYCIDNGLDPEDEDSAIDFIGYREDTLEESIEY